MSTIAERLETINTKLNGILTDVNTELTNKGMSEITDLSSISNTMTSLKNPTGTIQIANNGTVDVTNYASAEVSVNGGGGDITHEEYLADLELARSILEDFTPYIELEYIESTGNQYLITDYYPNQNTKIDIVMQGIDWGDYKTPFGVRTGINSGGNWVYTNRFALWLYADKNFYYHIGYNENRISAQLQRAYTSVKFNLIADNGSLYIKDLTNDYEAETYTFTPVANFTTDYTLPIGALTNTGQTYMNLCKFKLYSCKIYEGNTLIKDWIPAKNKVTDKIGLYDKVNGTFLYNAGTGEFVAGGVV